MSEHRWNGDGSSNDDDSDAAGGPPVPRGAVGYHHQHATSSTTRGGAASNSTSGRGWEGDNLERDRDQEHRRHIGSGGGGATVAAAVDLEQFRNYQVGKGYQARHVVRQRTAIGSEPDGPVVVGLKSRQDGGSGGGGGGGMHVGMPSHDASAFRPEKEERRNVKKSRKDKRKRTEASADADGTDEDSIRAYLECDAFRVFRKELESMLENP